MDWPSACPVPRVPSLRPICFRSRGASRKVWLHEDYFTDNDREETKKAFAFAIVNGWLPALTNRRKHVFSRSTFCCFHIILWKCLRTKKVLPFLLYVYLVFFFRGRKLLLGEAKTFFRGRNKSAQNYSALRYVKLWVWSFGTIGS